MAENIVVQGVGANMSNFKNIVCMIPVGNQRGVWKLLDKRRWFLNC